MTIGQTLKRSFLPHHPPQSPLLTLPRVLTTVSRINYELTLRTLPVGYLYLASEIVDSEFSEPSELHIGIGTTNFFFAISTVS
jgi:hypothetical protein